MNADRWSSSPRDELDEYVQHFQARALADALIAANHKQLLRRAEQFEAARHRPGIDYRGQATDEQLRTRWIRCTEQARALRAAASIGRMGAAA